MHGRCNAHVQESKIKADKNLYVTVAASDFVAEDWKSRKSRQRIKFRQKQHISY